MNAGQFESIVNNEAVGSPLPAEAKPVDAASVAIIKLDQRLAVVIILAPTLGVLAVTFLWIFGHGPRPLELVTFGVLYLATALGLEVGFHRHVTHQAFKAKKWVSASLIAMGSMGVHGPVIWWASTHRRHHSKSDVAGDPHSPHLSGNSRKDRIKGLYHSHMGWLFEGGSTRPAGWRSYVPDLYENSIILRQHMLYYRWVLVGLILPMLVCGLASWSWLGVLQGFLWGGLVRIFAVSHCIWALNSFCHVIGKRDFRTTPNDQSRNSLLLAIPTFGQGWHNNHHAFPASAFTGLHWWQIDPGGLFVRVLQLFRLVSSVNRPSVEAMARKRV